MFNQISRIKVTPLAGLARVGGNVFPKQLQQFDAIAYYNGPDGKPDTDDDLEIGRVNATWALEEYGVTYDDDDVKFVGSDRSDGTVHAEPRRSESAAQLEPQQRRRRVGRGDVSAARQEPRGRSRRARISSSPFRSM